jgi:hypothetical protein
MSYLFANHGLDLPAALAQSKTLATSCRPEAPIQSRSRRDQQQGGNQSSERSAGRTGVGEHRAYQRYVFRALPPREPILEPQDSAEGEGDGFGAGGE